MMPSGKRDFHSGLVDRRHFDARSSSSSEGENSTDTWEPVPLVEGVSGLAALFSVRVSAVSSLQWAPGISRPERAEARRNAVIK